MTSKNTGLGQLLERHEGELLKEWMKLQLLSLATRKDLLNEAQLTGDSERFLSQLRDAVSSAGPESITGPSWKNVRDTVSSISKARSRAGFSPSETATFVFSLKQPIFERIAKEYRSDPVAMGTELWNVSSLLDKLGLLATEEFQIAREGVISSQQRELQELSTPVITLWEGVLALPLIGTLDSSRTQTVMEGLLQRIVETEAQIAILDITGVPTVDTLVAQHLLKTVSAARLMGADCLISGIRPQIAQTIVHLGVELGNVTTKATLAEALKIAIERLGMKVVRRKESESDSFSTTKL